MYISVLYKDYPWLRLGISHPDGYRWIWQSSHHT